MNTKLANQLKELQSQLANDLWIINDHMSFNEGGHWSIDDAVKHQPDHTKHTHYVQHGCIIEGVVQMENEDQTRPELEANMKLIVLMRNNLNEIITALEK